MWQDRKRHVRFLGQMTSVLALGRGLPSYSRRGLLRSVTSWARVCGAPSTLIFYQSLCFRAAHVPVVRPISIFVTEFQSRVQSLVLITPRASPRYLMQGWLRGKLAPPMRFRDRIRVPRQIRHAACSPFCKRRPKSSGGVRPLDPSKSLESQASKGISHPDPPPAGRISRLISLLVVSSAHSNLRSPQRQNPRAHEIHRTREILCLKRLCRKFHQNEIRIHAKSSCWIKLERALKRLKNALVRTTPLLLLFSPLGARVLDAASR